MIQNIYLGFTHEIRIVSSAKVTLSFIPGPGANPERRRSIVVGVVVVVVVATPQQQRVYRESPTTA